jgi:hypothetical protein
MRRRRDLGLAAGVAGGLAGCTSVVEPGDVGPAEGRDEHRDGGNGEDDADGTRGLDVDLPVSREELQRGAPRDAIPAIVDPVFGTDWSGVSLEARTEFGIREITPRLRDGEFVVGVVRDGGIRAYPLRGLNHHEVVNDTWTGRSWSRTARCVPAR